MKESIASDITSNEMDELTDQFEKDFKRYTDNVQSFSELITKILKDETEGTFARKTGLSPNMFSRMRNYISKDNPPKRTTLMSVCIGYEIDYPLAERLFDSLGVGFSYQNRRDYSYVYLLIHCRGKKIDECNELLKELGFEEKDLLGSYARQPRQSRK